MITKVRITTLNHLLSDMTQKDNNTITITTEKFLIDIGISIFITELSAFSLSLKAVNFLNILLICLQILVVY